MTKKLILILTFSMLISALSMLSGCRSQAETEEGIFVPASEEYYVLDDGQKKDSDSDKQKSGKSNTNAKKASGKDKKSDSSDGEANGFSSSPTTTNTPSPTSGNGGSVVSGGAEDETPFVPATGSGSGKTSGSSKGDGGSGIE